MNVETIAAAIRELSDEDRLRLIKAVGSDLCNTMMHHPEAMAEVMPRCRGMMGRHPDMMAPILKDLGKKYEGRANVLFVHVREEQMLATRYGIQSIPVQMFFDKDGKEVFRHTGFFPQEEIEKKLKEIGID